MTREEIQSKYQQIAAQAGDAYFKLTALDAEIQKTRQTLAALTKTKDALAAEMAAASAESAPEATTPAP